jgi:hypothetical protein
MIEQVLIVSFIVYFIHASFWPDQIFGRVAYWLEERLPEKLTMPLFNCPICMTPWWGTLGILIAHHSGVSLFPDVHWLTIMIIVFSAAGLNTVLLQLNRIANVLHDQYEDKKEPDEQDFNK